MVSFNEKFSNPDIIKVLQASISNPGYYSPIKAWDSLWFSKPYSIKIIALAGSTIWDIDPIAPVLRCKKLGYSEENIVIDIIQNIDKQLSKVNVEHFNAFRMLDRTFDVMTFYFSNKNVIRA